MCANVLRFTDQSPIFASASPALARGSAVTERKHATPKSLALHDPPSHCAGGLRVPPIAFSTFARILDSRLTGRGVTTTAAPKGSRPPVIPKSLPTFRNPLPARGELDARGLAATPFRGFGGSDFRTHQKVLALPEPKKEDLEWQSAKRRPDVAIPVRTRTLRSTWQLASFGATSTIRTACIGNRSPCAASTARNTRAPSVRSAPAVRGPRPKPRPSRIGIEATMRLPVDYDALDRTERRAVREEYMRRQGGRCSHCGASLAEPPDKSVRDLPVDASLFPDNFFRWPVHLHHDHDSGMTIGAVHCHCNAVLWQYHNE